MDGHIPGFCYHLFGSRIMSDFEKSINHVLGYEGGYTNHPSDPGGPTKYGVTLADVRRFIDRHASANTVKRLTLEQAKEIYRLHYWNPIHGDNLPWPINFLVFDMAVNAGISRSVKIAQAVVGTKEDGLLGPITLTALQNVDKRKFNDAFAEQRVIFYRSLKRLYPTFGRGWINRVNDTHRVAKS